MTSQRSQSGARGQVLPVANLPPQKHPTARPLRIEFAAAGHHITSRGDRREALYRDDEDRQRHLAVIAQAMDRFDAQVLAYCLMGNHYHLVVQTRQANLSRLMRHINGITTQQFNRRHGLVGHLFQGRFKAILVDRDAYLLALCRYVERNPVAAGLVGHAGDWRWSSSSRSIWATTILSPACRRACHPSAWYRRKSRRRSAWPRPHCANPSRFRTAWPSAPPAFRRWRWPTEKAA